VICIGDADAFERLCAVEGADYERAQRAFRSESFAAFRAAWKEDRRQRQWFSRWALRPGMGEVARSLLRVLDGLVAARYGLTTVLRGGPSRWVDVRTPSGILQPTIYGYGGTNRYLVRSGDGAMFFHEAQGRSASLPVAREQGFLVFPSDLDAPQRADLTP